MKIIDFLDRNWGSIILVLGIIVCAVLYFEGDKFI